MKPAFRIGHGYDAHRFSPGRKLILGGVEVPYEKGLDGHSDADAAVHALIDALLGALALGDIGQWFPTNDETYENANSLRLLQTVAKKLTGYTIANVDITIVAQAPKLSSFLPQMRANIAGTLSVGISQVSVKATTEEQMGFTGRVEGIAAHAVALLVKDD
ncbi:MAG: 2-C-methyl-D-erythritol 2,4-cyclodiphosphate synthase [Oscillospiraceae bacterium]|jgi:2-C-methyl-D-erythritol 2,4-cyclodiphosphate synthase|nr:2-C-methyl-D-erythritol 2,4-cyclodiphosphate synthase [Oscillospiraceae bacterium]